MGLYERYHTYKYPGDMGLICELVHDSVAIVLYNVSRSVLVFVKQFRPAVLLAASLTDPSSTSLTDTNVSGYTLELCAGILDKEGESCVGHRH